ncbi:MAG: hypothetical protein HQ517_16770 [SAR324 cluster bacterium]|nr:hypothetical protein [SAR324 cluster bacterium]
MIAQDHLYGTDCHLACRKDPQSSLNKGFEEVLQKSCPIEILYPLLIIHDGQLWEYDGYDLLELIDC